jgi:hypothetical protein
MGANRAMKKIKVLPPQRMSNRPEKLDLVKLGSVNVNGYKPHSPESAIEELVLFDARCLDRNTRQELLRLLPQLVQVRRAWRAEFTENGCVHCRRKDFYGAGGFCRNCQGRFLGRMNRRYKKFMRGRNIELETAVFADALQLKYNAAQRLLK